jgi:hypothetical protein
MSNDPKKHTNENKTNQGRQWVYHKTEKPKIVLVEEAEELFKKGWAKSPAAFLDMKEHGLDPKNASLVQLTGEALNGVADELNKALNIDSMNGPELRAFAKDNFNAEFPVNTSKENLKKSVQELLDGKQGE